MKAFIRSIKIVLLKVSLIQEEEAHTFLRKFDMSFFLKKKNDTDHYRKMFSAMSR